MIAYVSPEEIRSILFSMPNNKAPGPDGFTPEFYKAAWPILGDDFVIAIQAFFATGYLPKGVNTTILALIPKTITSTHMKDYRPISCCNILYKVISKILARRLKTILPEAITLNQSAFVQKRLLIENVLLASELVAGYHKTNISSRNALKVDISKAFDSVQWSFLMATLHAMDIPLQFVQWVSRCVETASFSVQVNGNLCGFFQSSRGLRQGCSLSPYLFAISMNVLSKLLDKAAMDGTIGFHPRCKALSITHLCFADDILVFADGRRHSIQGIVEVFEHFARISGLRLSLEKTTLYLAGVSEATRAHIGSLFPYVVDELPVRYLGLPLTSTKLSIRDCAPLLDKIRSRIQSWSSRMLSFAGRLELISSVLTGITQFWCSAFHLPRSCLREVDRLCAAFLWSGTSLCSSKAKVAWVDVCKPRREGGLGLRSLRDVNTVFSLRLVWRLLSSAPSLWVNWIKRFIIRSGSFWTARLNSGSWMWRKLLKLRPLAIQFTRWDIGPGSSISFWHDHWSELGPLHLLTGDSGPIALGIPLRASIQTALAHPRFSMTQPSHRSPILSLIVEAIFSLLASDRPSSDILLWRHSHLRFAHQFNAKHTWASIRLPGTTVSWHSAIWFYGAIPKHAFISWLAVRDRLATASRTSAWSTGVSSLCTFGCPCDETRDHLFFVCSYSMQVWSPLATTLLGSLFSTRWSDLLTRLSSTNRSTQDVIFLSRITFQASIYLIWQERNSRLHGGSSIPHTQLSRNISTLIRQRILSLGQDRKESLLRLWSSTRFSSSRGSM